MYILQVRPGGADVALTAEECVLLARVCQLVEIKGDVENVLVVFWGALFRVLAEAVLARICLGPQGRQDLEEMLDELVY